VRFVVVGGGISGLAAALRLRDLAPEAHITIVEAGDRLGGKLRAGQVAGVTVEAGAEMFLLREAGADSAALALARRVGLGEELLHPAAVPAAVAVDGGLRPVPPRTLFGIPSDLSLVDGVADVVDDDRDDGRPLLERGADITVGGLVRPRFGDEVVDRLVDPMLGGVYAGHSDRLSLAATMPGLHAAALEQHTLIAAVRAALAASPRPAGQPVFATVQGGMTRLVTAVAEAARAEVWLGHPVRELHPAGGGWRLVVGSTRDPRILAADAVVLAVPGRPAARLLDPVSLGVAKVAASLDYASVALVTLALPPGTGLPALSGLLVPAVTGGAVKAATFITNKWPHLRSPDGPVLVRASLGRHGEEHELRRSDAELARLVHTELSGLLGTALPDPVAVAVQRWGGALPQYGAWYGARMADARAALPPTLALAGAAYDGVGIAACVRSGEAAATVVRQSST
jgi:oxygen-dependent protoporphyrinogen oxidase